LVEESIDFGVTHMRAFVEVDLDVRMKCLDAGLELKEQFRNRCYIQICVFAQNPIVSYEDEGKEMMELLEEAVKRDGVEVLGSTPYVEEGGDPDLQFQNMKFTIRTAMKYGLHLDFHIDYNLDDGNAIMVTKVLDILYAANWPSNSTKSEFRTIVFGHCTRLTLFNHYEWRDLKARIGDLPISFVGLPTSDLFMMGRPDSDVHPDSGGGVRVRGTLQIPQMIKEYGLNGAIGINNVGNAFTPQGSCDPLGLASLGVAVYQAGTKEDADILLVSSFTKS
jgi:cytosine/adenosine deaminase-related metal-dependent hydrolase